MFVATTLALSLVVSPVTASFQAPATQRPAATPAAAPASPSKPAGTACAKLDYRARIDVDASTLGTDAQGVATRLRSKAEQELQRNDIMLGTENADVPRLVVKVIPLPGEDEGYNFTIDITHGGTSPVKDGSSVGDCPLCTESELLEKVVGATRALAPKLRAYVADYNNKPCGCTSDAQCGDPKLPRCNVAKNVCEAVGAEVGCTGDGDCKAGERCNTALRQCIGDTGTTTPPSGGLSVKQKAGVALLAVGAVGVGIGIGLMVKKPVAPVRDMAWEYTTTKPPGIALLAVGGVAVVSGVILFVLGRRPSPPRNQVTPVAGAGFYGLSWSGRF